MQYQVAKEKLVALDMPPAAGVASIIEQLEQLAELERSGAPLPADWPAIWYALLQELRRLADFHERRLIRRLKLDPPPPERSTWAEVARRLDAGLTTKQGAQQRWSRLLATDSRPAGRVDRP